MKRDFTWLFPLLAALIFVATHVLWTSELPERVATHFDGAGRPNGWMSRQRHGVFLLSLGIGVGAFVVALCWVIRFLPPSLLNVPNAVYWRSPEHFPEACEKVARWGRLFATAMLVFFTLINWQVARANRSDPPVLDSGLLAWATGGFIAVVLGMSVWLVLVFSRKPERAR